MTRRLVLAIASTLLCSSVAACVPATDGINGSGATFPQQFQAWATSMFNRDTGGSVLYSNPGGGSSKGKSDFRTGLNDFGGTDSAVSEEQAPDFDWVYVPYVGGAVALSYRLDDLNGAVLSLSESTIGGIFDGSIDRWNHPAIIADMATGATWSNTRRESEVSGVTAMLHLTSDSNLSIAVLANPSILRSRSNEAVTVVDANTESVLARELLKRGEVTLVVPSDPRATYSVRFEDAEVARFEHVEVEMPNTPITVAYRQDGSGTTNNFCRFLSAASSGQWDVGDAFVSCVPGGSSRVAGYGSRFQGHSGSANLANYVSNTDGSIGYNEVSFILEPSRWSRGMRAVNVRNAAGEFVPPLASAVSSFLAGSSVDERGFVTFDYFQTRNATAYPIGAVTYALGRTAQSERNEVVSEYLLWILTDFAPRYAEALGYAPLTGALRERAVRQARRVNSE
ncbi:MAG: substrate-binding domain-containing protein [Ilumatobacteraceae bacterium]